MRESIRERTALLRIAPGLVRPMKVLVPTYGRATRGRLTHAIALRLNDLLSVGRNRHLPAEDRIEAGYLVSRDECLASFPWFPAEGLSGGAVWHDAQLRHPERLTLSFIKSAAGAGAVPVNYLSVDRLRTADGTVRGAQATDRLTGARIEISAAAVLVAAGPWTRDVVASAGDGQAPPPTQTHALGLNLVVSRRIADIAIGVQARSGPQDDPVCGGRRYLFCAPHGQGTILGTWYTTAVADPASATARGARVLLREFNDACPGLDLVPQDVVRYQWGWLPLKSGEEPGRPGALAERPRITDHGHEGLKHLISVEGAKFTTARRTAEQAVDRVFGSLQLVSPRCLTGERPLEDAGVRQPWSERAMLASEEIVRAVHQEMAVRLSDVVFRRTGLGAIPGPSRVSVEAAARVMAGELGWDSIRQAEEIEAVMREAGRPGAMLETVA
jgi:glycerol-3-phosphate dehydrogenase